jgi:hypothetical protein
VAPLISPHDISRLELFPAQRPAPRWAAFFVKICLQRTDEDLDRRRKDGLASDPDLQELAPARALLHVFASSGV